MRAIAFERGSARAVDNAPEPAIGSGEALVRVVRAGLGDADAAVLRGAWPDPPGVLGHELVGVVERLAEPVAHPRDQALLGKRVVASIEIACGKCDLCKRGLANHCRDLALLGLSARDGSLAERVAVPVRLLNPVPAPVDDDTAVFALACGAALHAAQMVRLEGRGFITVLGDSLSALLAAQAMARLNATVRLIGENPERFGLAERWGIKHRHADDIGRRQDQDVVVDCTGSTQGLDLALRLVRPRGTVILGANAVAVPHDPVSTTADLSLIARHEVAVIGARGGKVQEGVAALADKRFDVSGLITKRCRLAEAPAALQSLSQHLKIVVEP
ncbi:MAG: alcohol dehydrogenase catalytic domain-containing protein [Phycisphaerales bacterium]|nr:alcohol dehydrogenase catalytic domain-containing protein [Phycisphaerales bacterium]